MPFIGNTVEYETTDGLVFKLTAPLVFVSLERGCRTTIPVGFESDGCSTPKVIWNIIPSNGIYLRGAILHDWCYRETYLPQDISDGIFLEAMVALGVSVLERTTIYDALRLLGFAAFKGDRAALDARQAKLRGAQG
jgi:hypothetical protein